jgi:ketosteroid isomerase-like protein
VSAENVELVRSLQPAPDVDLVAFFADDDAAGALAEAAARFFDSGFECTMQLPGSPATTYGGVDGFRATWRDWLAPWASYRTEIEDLIDVGERVVVLARDYGRREPGAPEVEQRNAAVWTVHEGRVVRAEFYADRREGLAAAGLAE